MATDNRIQNAIISIMGKLDPSVKKSVDKATGSLKKLKVAAVASAAAIGSAAIASGKYLLDLGSEMDSAYDTIRIGTGATGKALENLKGDFEKVLSSMPTSSENASIAIADFNTRLGLSGKALQDVSKQALYLSENLGAGELQTVIEKSSRAFQAWNITEEEMTDKMDYLFKVSQSTGISFTDLAEKTQRYGSAFQALGYDFNSASTMIGQLVKNGVDVDKTLAGMQGALGKIAKKGLSASEGFAQYFENIKNAKTETEAMNIASEIFGAKNGALMAKAIRDGKLSVAALTAELTNSSETISGAANDTMDYAEKMQVLKNKMKVSLAPLGNSVFDSINALMPLAESGINALTKIISKFGKMIPDLVPKISKAVQKIVNVFNKIIPVVSKVINKIFSVVKKVFSKIYPIFENLKNKVVAKLPVVFDGVRNSIEKLRPTVEKVIGKTQAAFERIKPIIKDMGDKLFAAFEKAKPVIIEIKDNIVGKLSGAFEKIGGAVNYVIDNFEKFTPIIAGVTAALVAYKSIMGAITLATKIHTAVTTVMTTAQTVLNTVMNANPIGLIVMAIGALVAAGVALYQNWDVVKEKLSGFWEKIKSVFSMIGEKVTGIFNGIKETVSNVFSGLLGIIKQPFNAIIGMVNKVIGSINSIGFTIPDWVPIVGGKAFKLNIPEIPTFAQGGIATSPSVCGEGGYDEYVITTDPKYRNRNIDLLKQAADRLEYGAAQTITNNNSSSGMYKINFSPVINCSGDVKTKDIIQALKERMPEFIDMIQSSLELENQGAY